MPQIDRMAYPGAYARSNETLFAISRNEFGKASQLRGADTSPGSPVGPHPDPEEQR